MVCGPSAPAAELEVHPSIALLAVEDPARRVQTLRRQIRAFQPDWVLVSSEDLGHGLLREAHHSAPGRVVYLAHTPQFFPFGPASWNPDPHAAELVARAAGMVAIGRHMAEYIARELPLNGAGAPPARRGHPSAHLRPRPVPRFRRLRARRRHHGQSLRGEGHRHFSAPGRAAAGAPVCRRARLGHHC